MQVNVNAVPPCPRRFNRTFLSGIFIFVLAVLAAVLCNRAAEDLDFLEKGAAALEVATIAQPRKGDLRDRRDRESIPPPEHLAAHAAEETVKPNGILLKRPPAAQQKTIFAPDLLPAEDLPTRLKHETVFHGVPKQLASYRAGGVETFSQSQGKSTGHVLLEQPAWRANRFHILAWSSALSIAILIGSIIAGFADLGLHRHLLALLGWIDYRDFGAVPQGNSQSDLTANEHKTLVVRREMMQRHTLAFDEAYAWPPRPALLDASRSSLNRSELSSGIGHTWPYIESSSVDPPQIKPLPKTTGLNIDTEIYRISNGLIDDRLDNMPAHERLRHRIEQMCQTFAARPRRRF